MIGICQIHGDYKDSFQCPQCVKREPLVPASGCATITDTERLNWLLRNISGGAAAAMGLFYSTGLKRKHIDAAMTKAQNTELTDS